MSENDDNDKPSDAPGPPPSPPDAKDPIATHPSLPVRMVPLSAEQVSLAQAAKEAHLRRPLPKTEAFINNTSLSVREKAYWLAEIRATDMSDDDLLAALSIETSLVIKGSWTQRLARRLRIAGYEIERQWKQEKVLVRLAYAGSWLYLLLLPIIKLGLTWGSVISGAIIVSTKGWSFFNELKPKHMQILRRNYDQRKLALHKLINTQQLWYWTPPTARERFMFQHETLKLIESYVRDHRYDLRSKIFVNLLVTDGEEMVVINRANLQTRKVPQRYTREQCELAARTIEQGCAQMTGNVYEDFPGSVPGKKYVSILGLPVKIGTRVVGAVSIDSEGKHHFDAYFEELQTALAPYVQLLAIAMTSDHDRSAVPGLPGGDE